MDFNYQKICSNLLRSLPPKMNNVIERRFGLKEKRETLEAIGKNYNITRERVRQIEKEGFSKINPDTAECQKVFQYFHDVFESMGGFKEEKALISFLDGGKQQNQIFFLLTLADDFERFSEDQEVYSLWTKEKESLNSAKKIINLTLDKLEKEKKPFTLDELFKIQKSCLSKILNKKINKDIFVSCLEISKKIQKNPEGQFGLADWVEINPRGIKDKAYLILKKQGQPLHFTQVAILIKDSPYYCQNQVHTATVHNELIKDPRFVLVGRGLYGLKEWGYEPGVVKDIILKVLSQAKKPLSKKEILEGVLKQRIVKENTIFLNLQNKNYFLKDSQGRYLIKEN